MFIIFIYIYTRETPAFGVISLALRRSGSFGAAFGARLGNRLEPVWKEKENKFGTPGAPHLGRRNPLPSAAVKNK